MACNAEWWRLKARTNVRTASKSHGSSAHASMRGHASALRLPRSPADDCSASFVVRQVMVSEAPRRRSSRGTWSPAPGSTFVSRKRCPSSARSTMRALMHDAPEF